MNGLIKLIIIITAGALLSACVHQDEVAVTGTELPVNPSTELPTTETNDREMSAREAVPVSIEMDDYIFSPGEIEVKAGQKVVINLSNLRGNHDLVIDELQVRSQVLSPGGTQILEFTVPESAAGQEFEFYCSVGSHRQMGMVGKLIVLAD